MARLPPGFRFHPTDVELIMYYLKRKIMGKKLHFEAITELNIYKFSPWDLPEKCCYKSKDLEWYFFCPRERKYASGARMNRATETGFWKTTGKDRFVNYEEKVVGSVKTLVFHQGHPPRGQRTDWVIHEYKFIDIGSVQDTYVLCKVFQKSGPGPKNGAQYGAPFKEEDWDDDNVPEPCTSEIVSALPVLPEKRSYSIVTSQLDHGSTSRWPSSEPSQPFTERMPLDEPDDEEVPGEPNPFNVSSMHRIPLDEPDDGEFPGELNPSNVSSINWMPLNKPDDEAVLGGSNTSNILSVLPYRQSCSIGTSMINPCPGLSSALLCTNEMPIDEQDDEILGLLDRFTDDPPLLSALNENNQDGNDIFDCLGDINSWTGLGQSRSNLFASEGPNYSLNPTILPEDAAYVELNDLETPLDHSAETIETEQLGLGNFGAPYNSNIDMQHLCFGSHFLGTDHVLDYQLPMLPESYVPQVHHSDMVYNFQNNVNLSYNGATNFNVLSSEQPEDSRLAAQSLERGVQQRKFYLSSFALPVTAIEHLSTSGSICGGSFILVKAEVTPGIGGCTNEALSTILGGSCCVFTCQSNIYKADCLKEEYKAFCFGFILAFICFSHLNRLWFHTLWTLYDLSPQRYIQTNLELIQVSFCLHNC